MPVLSTKLVATTAYRYDIALIALCLDFAIDSK